MRYSIAGLAMLLALGATSCGGAEDGVLGVTSEAELDGGVKDYLLFSVNQNGSQIGRVVVTVTGNGGAYAAHREYWYMTSNVSTSYALTFTSGSAEYWSTPPSDLGTLSFTMDQQATWSLATPRSSMFEYSSGGVPSVLIGWNMTQSGGAWSGSINWYHNLTTNVFGASQTNTGYFGASPTGSWYRYTSTPL